MLIGRERWRPSHSGHGKAGGQAQKKERTASVMAPWIFPIAVMVPVPTTMHLALPAVTTVPCAGHQHTPTDKGLRQVQLTSKLVLSPETLPSCSSSSVHNLAFTTHTGQRSRCMLPDVEQRHESLLRCRLGGSLHACILLRTAPQWTVARGHES